MQKAFTLENGVRVYLWPWDTMSAGIAITLDTGSRYDPYPTVLDHVIHEQANEKLQGLTHCFEHVMARATRRWPTWQALADFADANCSDQNAETDKTAVAVYAATDRQRVTGALEFLADMALHPIISRDFVEYEKERAIEEYREYFDQPDERSALEFDRRMFGHDGLAHPILGTEETIRRITVQEMRNFHRRMACGQRLIVTVTGNFDPEGVERTIRRLFGRLRSGTARNEQSLDYRQLHGRLTLVPDNTQQVYCILGWPLFGLHDPRRPAMSILRNHLSGSTRMGSQIKVAASSHGKGYSAVDYLMHWPDVGQWHLSIPVSPDKFLDTLQTVMREVHSVRTKLLPKDRYAIALNNLTISAKARFSDPLRAATFIGAFIANAGSFTPLRTYLRELRSVTRRRIRRTAQQMFVQSRLCVVAHGPVEGFTKHQVRQAFAWPTD